MDLIVGGIDFNGDRRVDVIARNAQGDLFAYYGNGAGRLARQCGAHRKWMERSDRGAVCGRL